MKNYSLFLIYLALVGALHSSDSELTNYRTGIDVVWGVGDGSDKGTAYYEEYLYFDKLTHDAKIVYLKGDTAINMAHNARNKVFYARNDGGNQVVGINGRDGIADSGDEGIIRYKLDRDRQDYLVWSDNTARTITSRVLPAYTAPFTLASQQYGYGDAVNVVGTTGGNGGTITSKSSYYYRGIIDTANVTGSGDEYHVLSYADDDNVTLRARSAETGTFVDQKFYASDARTVLLVVNPKTPCFTARVTGTGQFYTTPPKAYWTPKIVAQTTYIAPGSSGTVTIELRDINGNNVFYRINGGSFTDAGAATVTLTDSQFSSGSNTLEYYYAGNSAYTKTRTVVKNPTHPSLAETHGNYLWGDAAGYSAVLSRITRAPYYSVYNNYVTRDDYSGSDQASWDLNANAGNKHGSDVAVIKNTFVAKVRGYTDVRSGASKSFGAYAKEMLLQNGRNNDPVGFEVQMSSGASGNRELHAFGYYESVGPLSSAFAYDIFAANFRSDQVTGGMTAIEDYYVRDTLANFAYEAMQWSAGMQGLGSPEMWGGARMMTSTIIGIVMPEYSTAYYGTSGFGTVQTKYPLCPYENDQYTWKEALLDGQTRGSYPNFAWNTGLSNNGFNASLFLYEGETRGGTTFELGDWLAKNSYFSYALMGQHILAWANMVRMWVGGYSDARVDAGLTKASLGTLKGAGDPVPSGSRFHIITALNSRFPTLAGNNTAYVQGLAPSNDNSDDKAISDAGVLGFAWYDDTYYGVPSGDTTPPIPSPTTWANAPHAVADRIEGTAVTTTDAASPPVAYVFSVVLKDATPVYDIVQSTPDLVTAGLTPGTQYDVQAKVRDAVGNYTTASTKVTVTTNAADVRTYRNPRNRRLFGR